MVGDDYSVGSAQRCDCRQMEYQLVFGFIANQYGLQLGYGVFGIFILSYFAFLFLLKVKFSKVKRT